jgi:hypothetical protein
VIQQATTTALAVLCLWACKGDADFSDAMPAPVTLNADEYRREISGIDRLVFEEKPFGETRRGALGSKLEELAKRVRAASDSRFITIEVLELKRLALMAKRFPPDAPRTALQNQWMRIRNNLFDDRSWFARSSRDLEAEPSRISN